MKSTAVFLFALLAGVIAPAQEKPLDAGRFLVYANGQQVGTEDFTIKTDELAEGVGAFKIGMMEVTLKTTTAYRGTAPLAFTLEQGTVKLNFAFAGATVKVTGAQELTLSTDARAVILENNVWHQYFFALARYDRNKGGPQEFHAFVPSIAQTLPITINSLGRFGGTQRYQLRGGPLLVEILALPGGNVIYVGVPAQKAEAVREEFAPQLEAIRAGLNAASAETKIDYRAPLNAPFTAEEVVVQAKGHQLAGTLLLPKTGRRPFPAAITITGSGQQTRDEPLPFPNLKNFRPFRQIAEMLASRGIAVLRVDDRGVGGSTGQDTLGQATTKDFADDTRAQVAYLRARQEIDPQRIALIGHSEGGIIAPQVAVSDKQIAAIVLMAGPGKTGADISLHQQRVILDSQPNLPAAEKEKAIAQQREVIRLVVSGSDLSKLPAEVQVPWIKEFWTYDPIPTMRRARQPVLILQGALDMQITADQAALLEKAARAGGNKNVTTRVFPKLNHLFLPCETGSFDEYTKLTAQALPDDVLQTLGAWLQKRLK